MMKAAVDNEGKPIVSTTDVQAADLPHDVTNNWEWQLVVAATEVALGPVAALIDNTGTDDCSPIKLMRESDYGA
ncbi:UNVERIFIED_CONTAM: hypothetical protein MKS84_14905 [Pseudomonas sp. JL1]